MNSEFDNQEINDLGKLNKKRIDVKKMLVWIFIVLLLIVGGFLAYNYFKKDVGEGKSADTKVAELEAYLKENYSKYV